MRAHFAHLASSKNRCDNASRACLMSASVLACAHKLSALVGVVGVFMDSMFVQHVTKSHEQKHRFISARSLTRTTPSSRIHSFGGT